MYTDHICISCKRKFEGGPRASYCPECREDRAKATNAKYRERKKAGKAREIGSTDICKICNKLYTVESGRQMYCKDCRPEQYKKVDRIQSLDFYYKNKDAINPARNVRRQTPEKICVICGKEFKTSTRAICCSPECTRKRKNNWWNEFNHKRKNK